MRVLVLLSVLLLTACSSNLHLDTESIPHNQLTKNYELLDQVKHIAIASTNFGDPSPSYITPVENKVDQHLAGYLNQQGYQVLQGNVFASLWAQAIDKHGAYFDKKTASYRRDRFQLVYMEVAQQLKEKHQVDAILFSDLLVRKVPFGYKTPHYARWDGVKFKPQLKGGDGVSQSYNWNKTFRALSLMVTMYNIEGQTLFRGVGGIEMIDLMNVKTGTPSAERRKTLLKDGTNLTLGIQLAMDPFIVRVK